jgi:hypothetical protein
VGPIQARSCNASADRGAQVHDPIPARTRQPAATARLG